MNPAALQTLFSTLADGARRIAPYLLTEILLPGGTLLALLLFLSRYRRARRLRNEEAALKAISEGVAGAQPARS